MEAFVKAPSLMWTSEKLTWSSCADTNVTLSHFAPTKRVRVRTAVSKATFRSCALSNLQSTAFTPAQVTSASSPRSKLHSTNVQPLNLHFLNVDSTKLQRTKCDSEKSTFS